MNNQNIQELKPIKAITVPIDGERSFTIFFTKDGIGISGYGSNPKSRKKHYMVLFDHLGVSIHETTDGKHKKHKHIGRLNYVDKIKELAGFIEEKVSTPGFMTKMMNPVLTNKQLLPLADPQNPEKCLEVHGRRAKVNKANFSPKLISASKLSQSEKHWFLVFRKARTRFHMYGVLLYANPATKVFIGIELISEILSRVGLDAQSYKNTVYIPSRTAAQNKKLSARQYEIDARSGLAALSPMIVRLSGSIGKIIKHFNDLPRVSGNLSKLQEHQ